MAVIVKSVETFELSITSTNRTATGTLTKGQTIADCVPFITAEVDSVGSLYLTDFCVDVYFDTDPSDEVVVERDATVGALTVTVTVVEFDSTYVTVQSAAYQMTSTSLGVTINTVTDLANAFSIAYGYQGSGSPLFTRFQVRNRLTAVTTLTMDRDLAGATWDGHWYVVEAVSGDFSVEALDITLTSVASNTGTITSVTENKTMIIGSARAGNSSANGTEDCALFCELTDDTTITVTRNGTGGTMNWSGYAVEFASGETVQRGSIIAQGATASQDVTITSVDEDSSMAIHAGNTGMLYGGSFPGTGVDDSTLDMQVRLTLTTSTNLQVTHDTTNSSADNDISWEVVSWDLGTSRRVMVVA